MVTISDKEFEKIYIAHFKIVASAAYKIVLDIEYAKDIAQEVFLKLHNYIENGNNVRDLQAWLVLTAKHTSIDFVRRFGKFQITCLNEETELKKDYAEEIIKRAYLKSIMYSLWRKNKVWYDMFLMKYGLGLSTEEIAMRFDCSNKTVENNLRRAKIYIKEQNGVSMEDYIILLVVYFVLINHL